MKVSEASGAALDWMVHQAWCEGACDDEPHPAYSTDWSQGGPIIERENIFIMKNSKNEWVSIIHKGSPIGITGLTPLSAAMRCYVTSKLGDEMEVPEDLL